MKCPICGEQMTNNRCYFCEAKNLANTLPKKQKKSNLISSLSATIFLLFFYFLLMGPFIVVGFSLTSTGLAMDKKQKEIINEYIEATGVLSDYVECKKNNKDKCKANYIYDANGNTYYATTSNIDNKKNFKQMEIIYYNPNNPEEYSIQVNTKNMIITGGAILALTILPLFFLIVITSIKRKKFN